MTGPDQSADIGLRRDNASTPMMSAVADIGAEIKRALLLDLRECKWSRADLAVTLSHLCGRTISEAQIDAYVAESKVGHRFPAEMIGAWVKATGSNRLLAILCNEVGLYLANQTERDLAELGRTQIRRERVQQEFEALKGELWHKVR